MNVLNSTTFRDRTFTTGEKLNQMFKDDTTKELQINSIFEISDNIFISYFYTDGVTKVTTDEYGVTNSLLVLEVSKFFNMLLLIKPQSTE